MSDALSASWLSTKWGVDTVLINAMRRGGELLAFRPAQSLEWQYPAWQFGPDGRLRPEVERALATARGRGMSQDRLLALLERRSGIIGGGRLRDDLLGGNVDHALDAIRRG